MISLFSSFIQWVTIQNIDSIDWTYQKGRILISGLMFMIGYILHRKFSFKDIKNYANGVLERIYNLIGSYLDFVHVDIVDSTFNQDANTIKTYRLEAIRAYWPNKEIHVHIMSKTPSIYVNEIYLIVTLFLSMLRLMKKFMIYRMIKEKGRKFGVVFSISH